MSDGYAKHRHSYTSGPNRFSGYRGGVWQDNHFEHSHADGERAHSHPDCGPAYFEGGISRAKRTKKPNGPQLEYVEPAEHERTFRVIFVDEYTPAHASAGISRERWERERATFIAIANGSDDYLDNSAAGRVSRDFGMTPIYEVVQP